MDIILQPLSTHNPTSLTIHLDQEYVYEHSNPPNAKKEILTPRFRSFNHPNPALTPTQAIPLTPSYSPIPQALPPNTLDLSNIPSKHSSLSEIPASPAQTHVVYTKTQKLSINHNIPNGFFNRTTWRPPTVPLNTLGRDQWDENQFSFTAATDEWVDLVVNNLDEGGHPFHMVSLFPFLLSLDPIWRTSSSFKWMSHVL
jgi:FtsP/CotA-like multicopper oxidase with cupredoxin domain